MGDFAVRLTALTAFETVSVTDAVALLTLVALVGEDGRVDGRDDDSDLTGVLRVVGEVGSGNCRG